MRGSHVTITVYLQRQHLIKQWYNITTRKLKQIRSADLTQISSILLVFICLCICLFHIHKCHIFFNSIKCSTRRTWNFCLFLRFWQEEQRFFQAQKTESTQMCCSPVITENIPEALQRTNQPLQKIQDGFSGFLKPDPTFSE